MNDIAYARDKTPIIKVKSVRPVEGYKLWLRFNTNEEKIFDLSPLLETPVYAPLKDKTLFESVYIDHGTIIWMSGDIDIATERLYADGIPV